MFLDRSMQAVVILACEKHAPDIVEKLDHEAQGNWFVVPEAAAFRLGYWPHVSPSHPEKGCAIFGFIEHSLLTQKLEEFAASHLDDGVCPNCAIYDWSITPLHSRQTSRDPVCKKLVSCNDSLSENYQDRLFFFCSPGCRDRFDRSPQEFVSAE